MGTIDNVVYRVGKFDGDVAEGRIDYERAKQGAELIKKEKTALEESLKRETGYSHLDLPEEGAELDVARGAVTFKIKSFKIVKKPQYKSAVEGMENYLEGIANLLSEGRTITGVVKEGRRTYVAAEKLLEEFDIIVAGIMLPDIRQNITHSTEGQILKDADLDKIVLDESRDPAALTEENFLNYLKMDIVLPTLKKYVAAYEKALSKGKKKEKVTAVDDKVAYKTTKSTPVITDWANVVKTLVTVPTDPDMEGELNMLADASVSKAEKERTMPHYKMIYHEVRGESILYISLESVYDRIQELKGSQTESKRLKVEPKELVLKE